MLWRYVGKPEVDIDIPFTDIDETTYYYEAVKWSYSNDIIKGITETEFSPLTECTREQLITFLYRYHNTKQ